MSNRVTVVIPTLDAYQKVFDTIKILFGNKPYEYAVEQANYTKEPFNDVNDKIISSDFLIADISDNDAREVDYIIGYAHGLNKSTYLILDRNSYNYRESKSIKAIPNERKIDYNDMNELKDKFNFLFKANSITEVKEQIIHNPTLEFDLIKVANETVNISRNSEPEILNLINGISKSPTSLIVRIKPMIDEQFNSGFEFNSYEKTVGNHFITFQNKFKEQVITQLDINGNLIKTKRI